MVGKYNTNYERTLQYWTDTSMSDGIASDV